MNAVEIPLTQGYVAIVDAADAPTVMQHRWHAKVRSNTVYAGTNIPVGHRKYRWTPLHRFLMNPPPGKLVDHVNRNGLDNRRSNLRVCTQSQNMRNRRGHGASSYLGVTIDARVEHTPWIARCGTEHLGRFATEADAASAYDEAARRIHGEFARPNFPNETEILL